MIRHIVLYRLKETAAGGTWEENIVRMKEKLEALSGQIEGLQSIKVSPDCNTHDYDVCLNAVFSDLGALQAYKKHPLHLAVSEFVHEVMTERAAIDYEFWEF